MRDINPLPSGVHIGIAVLMMVQGPLTPACAVPAVKAAAPALNSPANSANRPIKDKWAVVVGISKFRDEKINLRFPAKDAKDFYDYLTTVGNFAKDHVVLLTDQNATREAILTVLGDKWLPRLANPDDLVVVYISSHGSPADMDVGGVNYIVAHDTNLDCLYATGIPLQHLMGIIQKRVHSDRVVVVLDTCHSGSANVEAKGLHRVGNVDASAVMAGTGQMIIASSSPVQSSWEGRRYENSVFTYHLIKSLRESNAKVTLGSAFEQMKENVQEEVLRDRGTLQTPVLCSAWKGADLILSTPPTRVRVVDIDSPSQPSARPDTPTEPEASSDSALLSLKPIPPVVLLDNGNIYKVFNAPTRAASFSISYPILLTYIYTYHWNNGRGAAPGTLALRHQDGTVYGPWRAVGKPGQGGVPNAYWECEPLVRIKQGQYTILDSDAQTWSQNSGSRETGFARVKGAPLIDEAAANGKVKRSPSTTIVKNGNVYRVFNGGKSPRFNLKTPTLITNITDYHWNDGRGSPPGTVSLIHEDGTIYGPWQCNGRSGQWGAPEVYWDCPLDVIVKAGKYKIVDSDPSTWSQNSLTGDFGMTEITGVYQQ